MYGPVRTVLWAVGASAPLTRSGGASKSLFDGFRFALPILRAGRSPGAVLWAVGSGQRGRSPVCPQNRAYGSVHGSSRKAYRPVVGRPMRRFLAAQLVWVVRRSIGLVDACHSLCVGPSSICAVAVRPVFTSRSGVRLLFRADLNPTVFHALRFRLRVPLFTSSLLATDSMFYPHRRHRRITGTELYDYYGFICWPPSHNVSRLRAA